MKYIDDHFQKRQEEVENKFNAMEKRINEMEKTKTKSCSDNIHLNQY